MKIKVENESLIRDTASNAILETDKEKLQKHRALRRSMRDKSNKIDELVKRIESLEALVKNLSINN